VRRADAGRRGKQTLDGGAVAVERDVQDRDEVAGAGAEGLQQLGATLRPGDELARAVSFRQHQLLQRAEAVRVAVESENPP
jgi:hypothetical protein